jgi:hypothetical protein
MPAWPDTWKSFQLNSAICGVWMIPLCTMLFQTHCR